MTNERKITSSIKSVAVTFLVIAMAMLNGCKKNDPPSPQETVTTQLTSAAAWQSPVVTVDGVDKSDVYKDFSITFGKNTYTTQSGSPIWKASGTWAFANAEATKMKLDGNIDVEINFISTDILELSLQWNEDTFEPGRVNSVKGKNKFKLKKK